jgi:hypothetical protein
MTADEVLLALQGRYDYYSARTVLKHIAASAGVSSDGPFDGAAVGKLADALLSDGSRVNPVVDALREAASSAKPAAKKPAAKKPAAEKPAAKKAAAKKPAAKKPAAAKK